MKTIEELSAAGARQEIQRLKAEIAQLEAKYNFVPTTEREAKRRATLLSRYGTRSSFAVKRVRNGNGAGPADPVGLGRPAELSGGEGTALPA